MNRIIPNTLTEIALIWSLVLFAWAQRGFHAAMDQGIAGVENHTHFILFLASGGMAVVLALRIVYLHLRSRHPSTKGLALLGDHNLPEADEREAQLTAAAARRAFLFHSNGLALLIFLLAAFITSPWISPMAILLALALLFTLEQLLFLGTWVHRHGR